MNVAYLMKQCDKIYNNPDNICVQVLKGKYDTKGDWLDIIINKKGDSYFWKYLMCLWQDFFKLLMWKIRDGNTIAFWRDD